MPQVFLKLAAGAVSPVPVALPGPEDRAVPEVREAPEVLTDRVVAVSPEVVREAVAVREAPEVLADRVAALSLARRDFGWIRSSGTGGFLEEKRCHHPHLGPSG